MTTGLSVRTLLVAKIKIFILAVLFVSVSAGTAAEPWIDTRHPMLRTDIERLSQAGIITVPINTWPLMWGGILNNLETYKNPILPELQDSYGRAVSAGRRATRTGSIRLEARLSVASESQLFRHYGGQPRDRASISLRRRNITDHFAYNLEITRVNHPWDGDQTHYDNSYFGFVVGNWVGLLGNIERWWGPGWNSSLILSNNARPAPGLTLQRNYSDASELPIIRWLGPWTTSAFIAQLDDKRHIDKAKLVGMTLGFRPGRSLEINLRRTAQWGGEGRPQGFKNFIELVTGLSDNCETSDCRQDEPGNQLAAIDVSWHMPRLNTTIYAQTVNEDESGALPSRSSRQDGLKKGISSPFFSGQIFIEDDNTSTLTFSQQYNILYNHSIYKTGYRYQGRVVGATWDNDSKVASLGILGLLSNGDVMEVRYSFGDINMDSINALPSQHSISTRGGEINLLTIKFRRSFLWGEAEIEGCYSTEGIDEFGRQDGKLSLGATLTHRFD
jgi:hypothetical protein